MGDFNEVLSYFEKKGGRLRSDRQIEEFRGTLDDCELHDLGYTERWFTWERGRFLSTNIRERLDRGVASCDWLDLFPYYQVEHLSHAFSDHCPLLLDTMGKQRVEQVKGRRRFRFEAKWCLDSSFEEVVKNKWNSLSGSVPNKLDKLGQQLYQWDKSRNKEKMTN
ncbi:hypothetical protein J1N35_026617 [Gossypium stocksii]|uniref:Endonuclease/exonuclease/phosphatase domain-containing protein n=1 Tax=Gossypium stocksii TaxID=47602 RepID=A0A9D3V8Q5_9ROSI|nr:hypothetical protein J1N35_026617 [Gossypium stocksii]